MNIFKNTITGFLFLFFFGSVIHCQEISGLVFDTFDNEPLIGANIVVKGTNIGAVTDVQGKYKIKIDSLHKTLCYCFIGYYTKDIEIDGKTIINVVLEKEPLKLERIILTDYIRKDKPTKAGDIIRIITTENYDRADTLRHGQIKVFENLRLQQDSLDALIPRINRGEFSRDYEFDCFRDFLFKRIQFPQVAKEQYVEGKIVTSFNIDTLGNLKDIKFIRNIDYLGEEVLEALQNVPKWIQVKMGETQTIGIRRHEMTYILSIGFKLEELE